MIIFIFTFGIHAEYQSHISTITSEIKTRMVKGKSYRAGCPVGFENLRYVTFMYKNFNRKDKIGELIVHKDIADEVVKIFEALYDADYPINQMRLVSDFGGNDWQSIEADNTSAFNCRNATGSKKWSKHSYGRAIDINPIENPYVFRSGYISHKASLSYKNRIHVKDTSIDKAVLLPEDEAVKIFKKYGWQWGGEFNGEKDYQHFQK